MSRCFPFPPPGYSKRARTDEVDLLKKEKQREKKRKKDKRDKEKRESKEKREREGRDGKHKEKDKKEKHREKKKDKVKDKGRDRDKSKISTTDDKGFPGQAEGPNAGKLHQKEIKQNDKGILCENKVTKQYTGNNGEKARENNHLAEENKDSKFLLELDRRIKDDGRGASNQLAQNFTHTDHGMDEGAVRLVAKGCGTWPDGKEKLKDKGLDAKKIDGKGIWAGVRPIGNATNQNHAGNFHHRVEGMPKLLGKYFDRNLEATVEGKEKIKENKDEGEEKVTEKKDEGEEKVKERKDEGREKVKEKKDDKRGDKRKEKEKKGHGKDKDRDKKKKKEEKVKEHTAFKNSEQNKLKDSNKVGHIGSDSFTRVSSNSHEDAISKENLKKRKDNESNGVPCANDNWPSKLPRPSSNPHTENGRILEPCQTSIPNASDRPGVVTSVKVDSKECKINGVIEGGPIAVSSNKTHTVTVPADLVTEASAKPAHPDSKYLSQVYSVPKVEWSDFDDQDWLFGSSISQERKPVVESSEVGETLQVWAEALHIEPADVFALPYVIPY